MARAFVTQNEAPAQARKRLFDVEEYYRMAEAGILSEDDHVELIEGEIFELSPIGSRHAARVDKLNFLLGRAIGDRAIVRVQSPIRISEHTEPEPDIALLHPREDFYAASHPAPEDVLLLVEVAETSAAYDREVKLPLYARTGIPEVWLVDLAAETVELHSRLTAGEYRETLRAKRGETLESPSVSVLVLAADDLLA